MDGGKMSDKNLEQQISTDLLRNAQMFHRVITGDETWYFQ
jgi:hypothetical protein